MSGPANTRLDIFTDPRSHRTAPVRPVVRAGQRRPTGRRRPAGVRLNNAQQVSRKSDGLACEGDEVLAFRRSRFASVRILAR